MNKYLEVLKTFWIVEIVTGDKFKKRLSAFLWHSGAMVVAGLLDLTLQSLMEYDADNILTIVVGLVFAQITKALNNPK